jgi:hypothetical protein
MPGNRRLEKAASLTVLLPQNLVRPQNLPPPKANPLIQRRLQPNSRPWNHSWPGSPGLPCQRAAGLGESIEPSSVGPRPQQAPNQHEFPQVVGIVVCNQQGLTQNSLSLTMRNAGK